MVCVLTASSVLACRVTLCHARGNNQSTQPLCLWASGGGVGFLLGQNLQPPPQSSPLSGPVISAQNPPDLSPPHQLGLCPFHPPLVLSMRNLAGLSPEKLCLTCDLPGRAASLTFCQNLSLANLKWVRLPSALPLVSPPPSGCSFWAVPL